MGTATSAANVAVTSLLRDGRTTPGRVTAAESQAKRSAVVARSVQPHASQAGESKVAEAAGRLHPQNTQ